MFPLSLSLSHFAYSLPPDMSFPHPYPIRSPVSSHYSAITLILHFCSSLKFNGSKQQFIIIISPNSMAQEFTQGTSEMVQLCSVMLRANCDDSKGWGPKGRAWGILLPLHSASPVGQRGLPHSMAASGFLRKLSLILPYPLSAHPLPPVLRTK